MDLALPIPSHPRLRLERLAVMAAAHRTPRVVFWMVLAVVGIAVLAYVDARRESEAGLGDFSAQQEEVALAIASVVSLGTAGDGASPTREDVLARLREIERPGRVVVLAVLAGGSGYVHTDGSPAAAPDLDPLQSTPAGFVRLSRPAARALRLPERTAVAGYADVTGGSLVRRIAVVATAARQRDRAIQAQRRLVGSIAVGAGLVLAFGLAALRRQRMELELARELAVADATKSLDERLVRADKLATLGALGTGIAHEVSTPLGVIVGRAEQLLPRVTEDARATRAVEAILEHAERIRLIVGDFLALARGQRPSLSHLPADRVADRALELVQHRFDAARVTVSPRKEGAVPIIACDPRLFEHVLVNLLLNACDASAPGQKVELVVRREGGSCIFEILDEGCGIGEEEARRATEPFFTTKALGKGAGLGLAIANEIVKHHHGSLRLESRAGSGSEARRGTRAEVTLTVAEEQSDG